MLPGDKRSAWKQELLDDPRAAHFWDAQAKTAGAWFRDHVGELKRSAAPGHDFMQGAFGNKRAAWDVYFVYGRRAKWDEAPSPLVSWGRPVYRVEGQLRADFEKQIAERESAPPAAQ